MAWPGAEGKIIQGTVKGYCVWAQHEKNRPEIIRNKKGIYPKALKWTIPPQNYWSKLEFLPPPASNLNNWLWGSHYLHVTQQSINTRRHWWPVPGSHLTCASSRSTLGTQMWRYECCPSEQKVPPGPFLERWNIECDMGSNCMGSNQLDTQLKETWGLRAARPAAPLDSVDVPQTNPGIAPLLPRS